MTTNLDMGGYRILNIAHPRDLREYESDRVTSKILYDYMSRVEQNYMRRDRDGSLDGRLNMSNHRINGLADPTDADDAVTRRYVASRFQALVDEIQGNKSKLGAFLNLLGVENNQVLLRKYELIDADFEHVSSVGVDEGERIIGAFLENIHARQIFLTLQMIIQIVLVFLRLKKILCYIYSKNLLATIHG